MAIPKKDPTDPIRLKASSYPDVVMGTACTQSSFKIGKKAFLFIGMQGGQYKAMFKLNKFIPDATKLAEKNPDCYSVGKTGWVTVRFTADKPMPKTLWGKWLDESYKLSIRSGSVKKAADKRTPKKKIIKKSASKKTKSKT